MSQPTKFQVEMTIRCKAFTGQGVHEHRVMVDDANVRVYDPIAGYFTLCHSLSKSTIRRIIARAAKVNLSEQEKWRWAVTNQGFEGDFAAWQALSADERDEYELGAARIPTA